MELILLAVGLCLGFGAAWWIRAASARAALSLGPELERARSELDTLRAEKLELSQEQARHQERALGLQNEVGRSQTHIEGLDRELTERQNRLEALRADLTREEEQRKHLERATDEREVQFKEMQEKLQAEFKVMASELLEDKSKKFTELNRSNLDLILKPLHENIDAFKKKVQETYEKETRERQSLKHELERLHELNHKMSEEANHLTQALKGQSQTQGAWGEMILERTLELSGLKRDMHYKVQENFKSEDQRDLRPDVVLYMPEDKQLVIDSKVSLTDYERYSSAETDEERERAQKAHLQSIRTHIKELSQKNYQNLYELKSVDFVLMFVPIESAFSLAVQTDLAQNSGAKNIFAEALEQNVVMVTTSTLLATLRTVESIWRQENQNRHALEIARRSGKMYDKLVGFVTDLQQIGSRLDQTQKSYQNAMGKLSEGKGNLVRQAEQIRELGAKASKSLPADVVETSMSDPLQLN